MRPTVFQKAELRDENNNIIQQGTYGKGSALSNSTNDGWIDYVMNNLEALFNNSVSTDSPSFTGTPTAPTPTAGDNSTKIATTAFTHNEIQTNALAITTAYMTEIPSGADLNTYLTAGSYRCTGSGVAASLVNTPYTGSNFTLLVIHGGNPAKYARQILFTTSDAVATTNIIYTRSCDGSGNNWTSWKRIAYAEDVLPLSGGIMTGDILFSTNNESTVKKTVDNSAIRILGGSAWDCGGSIFVYGKNNSGQNPGGFELNAHDGTNVKSLVGKPSGILRWDGATVVTESYSGTIVWKGSAANAVIRGESTTSGYSLFGGSELNNGSSIYLCGNDDANAGQFRIRANSGTSLYDLIGTKTGSLTWQGQPIQTSSDKRLKQDFADVPADVLEAWSKVEWKQFKYKADAERKGDSCRFHTGLVAQDVKEVGEANHVDLLKYGILCHDVREAVEEEKDEDGNIIREASEAVDLWTIRYEEALAMEAAYQRRRADRLEERIEALEKLLMNRTE